MNGTSPHVESHTATSQRTERNRQLVDDGDGRQAPTSPEFGHLLNEAANLTKFQSQILAILADGGRFGSDEITEALITAGYRRIKNSRLYRNLDTLDQHDLIDVDEFGLDGRSHAYSITEYGRHVLHADWTWYSGQFDPSGAEARGGDD